MVAHAAGAGRKDRHVRAAFLLQAQLRVGDAVAQFVVGNDRLLGAHLAEVALGVDLFLAPGFVLGGGGGVMAVAIDNH